MSSLCLKLTVPSHLSFGVPSLCPQFQRQDEVWKLELEDVIYSDAAETFFLAHLKCTMAPWYIN